MKHTQQFHLNWIRNVVHIIEEERSPVGELESAETLLRAPIKAPNVITSMAVWTLP